MNFLTNMILKSQLKKAGIPEEQQVVIIEAIGKNPELFKKIGEEAQAKIKTGMSQQDAMMSVMQSHQTELQEALKK